MGRFSLSGGLLVFLGAAFWSLNSPLVKYLSLDSLLICGLRSLIAAIVLASAIRPKQLKWNRWMSVYVCSYAGLCLSIILALGATSAPVAIGMQYTAAIWLFLVNLLSSWSHFCSSCHRHAVHSSNLAFSSQSVKNQTFSYPCFYSCSRHF